MMSGTLGNSISLRQYELDQVLRVTALDHSAARLSAPCRDSPSCCGDNADQDQHCQCQRARSWLFGKVFTCRDCKAGAI